MTYLCHWGMCTRTHASLPAPALLHSNQTAGTSCAFQSNLTLHPFHCEVLPISTTNNQKFMVINWMFKSKGTKEYVCWSAIEICIYLSSLLHSGFTEWFISPEGHFWDCWPIIQSSHCIIVTSQWVRWRLKSPAQRLFTQLFILAQIKENIKAPRHWAFVRGVHRWPVNSPPQWPVTRKMFPFDDVIMVTHFKVECR